MTLKTVKIIAASVIGVCNVGGLILHHAANKHAEKRAAEKAVDMRPNSDRAVYNDAVERCDIYKARSLKEKKELENRLKDWKVANSYDFRKAEIADMVEEGLDEFKDQIGYSGRIEELDENIKASIEAFKNTIDYDSSKRKLEQTIQEAKDHYEAQKKLFDLADDNVSETAMKLRHAEEEIMTGKIKEAKAQLDILEGKLKEETEKLQNAKLAELRTLEEHVSKEKLRLLKKSDQDMLKLNKECDQAKEDIAKSLRKARSEEETVAFKRHEEDIRIIREQEEADSRCVQAILDDTPAAVRIGEYLKSKNVSKPVVAIVGGIPVAAAGFLFGCLVTQYGEFIGKVMRAIA